ncbi:MAG: glutamine--fructose-6-phosphate transaminase (isomerizing) [Candidatus Firestonebacteria bacterium]
MCGIVGYAGGKFVDSVLIVGLERLEYRGYDSAGAATIVNGELGFRKKAGKLKILDESLKQTPLGGNIGIAHTRWATHGAPSEQNAHPHFDCKQKIAVVHNGIIENYSKLREELTSKGHVFESETDSEVVPHLIEDNFKGDFKAAVIKTLAQMEGSFALVIISEHQPDSLIAVRKKSPLAIGVGKEENLVASDISPLLTHTNKIIYLEDGELAVINKDKVEVFDFTGKKTEKTVQEVSTKNEAFNKNGFDHFMQKEIFEQPEILRRILSERIGEDGLVHFKERKIKREFLAKVGKIVIQACGTSWHAALIGKFLLEKYVRIPTEVEISSEFRYRNPILGGDTLVMAISQSGETADTLAGIREAKVKFTKVWSFVNVETSTIAKESDCAINMLAGPEIGVASTKAYTAQLMNLFLFTLYVARLKYSMSDEQVRALVLELNEIPGKIKEIVEQGAKIKELAKAYSQTPLMIFLGRGVNYPSALEGALKLKEISYMHALGYPAGEFKHGPIALVDEKVGVVCIMPEGELFEKMASNVHEAKARKAKIIAIATESDNRAGEIADSLLYIPKCSEILTPLLTVIPLQLFAYYIALEKGCDVDRPRNLAKSVTVE